MNCPLSQVWTWQVDESLGVVYELDDYKTPSDEVVKRFQAMIDKAFGRTGAKD